MLGAVLAFSTLRISLFLTSDRGIEVAPTGGEVEKFEGRYQE